MKPKLLSWKPLTQPKTSIIATIGGPKMLKKYGSEYFSTLIDTGMNIARINLSHLGNPEDNKSFDHIRTVTRTLTKIAERKKRIVAFLFDIAGPKIRVGKLNMPIKIKKGDELILYTESKKLPIPKSGKVIPITYKYFYDDIEREHRVLINDGKIELIVDNKRSNIVRCKVTSCSVNEIAGGNGINLPDTTVSEATLTDADDKTLEKLMELKIAKYIDFLGQSFVREPRDIHILRDKANIFRPVGIPGIIAKIETWQAVRRVSGKYGPLDDILRGCSGVMVARGDLAGETSPGEVPVIQSYLSKKGIEMGKAVIIATQMLASMTGKGNTRPLRSEASDVANAVFDYVDAVMLSEETATGENPFHCVETMQEIVRRAEDSQSGEKQRTELLTMVSEGLILPICGFADSGLSQIAIAEAAIRYAEILRSPAIIVSTSSGDTAIKISRYKPLRPIIAITHKEKSAKKMLLYRGIYPVLIDRKPFNFEDLIKAYKDILETRVLQDQLSVARETGSRVLLPLTLGIEPGDKGSVAASGNTNTIYILDFPPRGQG